MKALFISALLICSHVMLWAQSSNDVSSEPEPNSQYQRSETIDKIVSLVKVYTNKTDGGLKDELIKKKKKQVNVYTLNLKAGDKVVYYGWDEKNSFDLIVKRGKKVVLKTKSIKDEEGSIYCNGDILINESGAYTFYLKAKSKRQKVRSFLRLCVLDAEINSFRNENDLCEGLDFLMAMAQFGFDPIKTSLKGDGTHHNTSFKLDGKEAQISTMFKGIYKQNLYEGRDPAEGMKIFEKYQKSIGACLVDDCKLKPFFEDSYSKY
jgi:hypothetical protein